MKKFHLIETTQNGLRTVQSFLSEMNAVCTVFSSVKEAIASESVPDMLVLLAPKEEAVYREAISMLSQNRIYGAVPRISVLPMGLSMHRKTSAVIEGESEFPMPVDRSKFQLAVANCLKIPQRRAIQIIITIHSDDSNLQFSGLSTDFSETGMGFECRHDFAAGSKIKVSFVNPRTKSRLSINAEVVRKIATEYADRLLYGVKFTGVQAQLASELRQFVAGS